MSTYRVKIKINDFFPKIDAIPYDDFICLISCNNYFSRIKLTEYENQQFKFDLKIIKNTDLLFTIKLINYIDNNKLVGMYNLIIPHNKVNQILQREISLYKQQVKLIMNSNIKIKLFGIMMNITNIYLDLIFQISSVNRNIPVNNNYINKMKIYEMLGNNSYAKNYSKSKKKNKSSNNSVMDGKKTTNLNINLSKSPNINYNNFMSDFKENELNREKKYGNLYNNNYQNIDNKKCSDINFNVMNYNYLNYVKLDNNNNNDNNYVSNVKFNINSRSPIIISKNNIVELNERQNNNRNYKPNKSSTYYNLLNKDKINNYSNKNVKESNYTNYQNVSTKKKEKNKTNQIKINPFMIQNNINNINDYNNYDDLINYTKISQPKYLTEVKNNKNPNNITNEYKNTDANQVQKNTRYQNLIKNNSNHKISYINYINKGNNILYDKKNHLNKFISNSKTGQKYQNSNQDAIIDKKNQIVKTQVFRNKINFSEYESQTNNTKIKTPRNLKDFNSNINDNSPFIYNVSSNKKDIDNNSELNNLEINNFEQLILNIDDKKEEKNKIIKNEDNETKEIDRKENNNINKNNQNEENTNKESDKKENNNINKNNKKEDNDNKEIAKKGNIENITLKKTQEEELLLTPEEFKNKIINSLEESQRLKKEIISQLIKNREYNKKLLLIKEKFFTELKIRNHLIEKTNNIKTKTLIHVNIRGKLNSNPYFIKTKESSIFYKIFYEHKNSPQYKALEAKKKLKEKMEQQKKVHSLLNFVRELIKKYENLSQIYNEDEKKKILFKSLLLRYGIREKEESKENNLMDKFKEIKMKLEEEKKINLMKEKQKEMQNDLYKNVIKEEDDEERSSISEHQFFQRKSSLRNRVSWCSDDSFAKEKENFESNKSNNNNEDGNNSLLSSGLKRIKESVDEDLVKNEEKGNVKEDKVDADKDKDNFEQKKDDETNENIENKK